MIKNFIDLFVVIIGLIGFSTEVFLLREFLIIFSGNEFVIGIIIANWLLLEAFGSFFVGKTAEKNKKLHQTFIFLNIIFCISAVLAVYLIRVLKPTLGFSIGESLTFLHIFLSSFFILLPVSVSHGALFTYSCKIHSNLTTLELFSISKVYILEVLGTVLGSFVSYLLITKLHTFKAMSILIFINIFCCLIFVFIYEFKPLTKKFLVFLNFIFLLISFSFIFISDKIHLFSIKKLWKNQNIIEYQNSKYNNICITEYERQYTFFINGKPTIIIPLADITFLEEYVHIPLLSHKNPKKILIISGAVGGVLNEILKHPTVEYVDYVELDPLLLNLIEKIQEGSTHKELKDFRVNIQYLDGRQFIKITDRKYDVIFLGVSEPEDLQTNRFFTKEFFKLIRAKLNPNGILVLTLNGSLTYLSDELIMINSCIYNTLLEEFKFVRVFPGDGKNIFLATDNIESTLTTKETIVEEILKRKIKTNVFLPKHIEYKLNPRWQEWFLRYIQKTPKIINSDLKPQAVFYSIAYWNKLFAPYINKILYFIKDKINFIIKIFIIVWLALIIFFRKKLKNLGIPICISTTGFAGMLLSLILIFSFQSVYGYVFSWVGLLTGFYMIGSTIGVFISNYLANIYKSAKKVLVLFEVLLLLFSIFLILFLIYLKPYFELPKFTESLKYIFLFLTLISGIFSGGEFPVGFSIQKKDTKDTSKTTGLIYSLDLLGGWLAGVLSGFVLLPILGILGSCVVVLIIKLLSITTLIYLKNIN